MDKRSPIWTGKGSTNRSNRLIFDFLQYWPGLAVTAGAAINRQLIGVEIRALPKRFCKTVVEVAGNATEPREFQWEIRPRGRRQDFIHAALSCLHDIPFSQYRMSLADAATLKFMLSELPPEVYETIPDEVFYKNLRFFQGGCLTTGQRQALRNKLISTMGLPSAWTYNDITLMGCLIYDLDSYDFDLIRDEVLQDNVQALGTCWDSRNEKATNFRHQCEMELGPRESDLLNDRILHIDQRLALLAQRNTLVERRRFTAAATLMAPVERRRYPAAAAAAQQKFSAWTLADESSAASGSAAASGSSAASGYRNLWYDMRSFLKDPMFNDDEEIGLQLSPEDLRFQGSAFRGLNMTCDWFRAAGSHVISLPYVTFTDPKNMSSAEFIKCIPLFAEFNWPRQHREALWERVKKEVGFPSPPEMETMGFLLLSMSEFELRQIDFSSSLDLLWSFGALDGWSDIQLKSLAQQFAITVGSPPEQIDEVRLVSLGYILCGISSQNVVRMNTGAYCRYSKKAPLQKIFHFFKKFFVYFGFLDQL